MKRSENCKRVSEEENRNAEHGVEKADVAF